MLGIIVLIIGILLILSIVAFFSYQLGYNNGITEWISNEQKARKKAEDFVNNL